MGLRDQLLRMPIEQRFTYHPGENRFFVNLKATAFTATRTWK